MAEPSNYGRGDEDEDEEEDVDDSVGTMIFLIRFPTDLSTGLQNHQRCCTLCHRCQQYNGHQAFRARHQKGRS